MDNRIDAPPAYNSAKEDGKGGAFSSAEFFRSIDQASNAATGRLAFASWEIRLGAAPGKPIELACYVVHGRPVAFQKERAPIVAVGTEHNHIATWRPVEEIRYLSDVLMTFAVTSGGHKAGTVSEPAHPHRRFNVATKSHAEALHSADNWIAAAEIKHGSCWPAWGDWLATQSTEEEAPPPTMGALMGYAPLADAPGTYVLPS